MRREGGRGLWKTLALWTGRVWTPAGPHDLTAPRKTPFLTETWNPGKNFFLKSQEERDSMQTVCVCVSCSVMSDSLWPHGLQPGRLLCPWNSPGKNTGVRCHSLLQGIFLTQGSNLSLPHCWWILYCLSHQGSPASKLRPIKLYFMFYVCQIVSVKSRISELPEITLKLKSTCKWLTVWQMHSVPLIMALV